MLIFQPSLSHAGCRNERQERSLWFLFSESDLSAGAVCELVPHQHDAGPVSSKPGFLLTSHQGIWNPLLVLLLEPLLNVTFSPRF